MTRRAFQRALAVVVSATLTGASCSPSGKGVARAGGPSGRKASATSATSITSTSKPDTTAPNPTAAGSWWTYDGDPARTAKDRSSPVAGAPHPAWTSPVLDGAVYAQPLVAGTTVIVATENDTLYSLSASNGTINWSRHLGTPVRGVELPCGDIDPSGITGTPVADLASNTLWVVSFSSPAGSSPAGSSPAGSSPTAHTLWQVSLQTGEVLGSRPADPPGADPRAEQQRGALTLASGRVYIPYGGLYGDCGDFHGWLVGLSATAGADHTMVTYETQADRAGIWAPPGPVVDGAGDLLVATGNGLPANVPSDANSVVRLDPSLHVVARFTAPDYQRLSENDTDLGSVSPSIVAGGNVLQVGKEGVGYLLPPNLSSPLQTFHVCGGAFGGTAVDADDVFIACFDGLYALAVSANGHASIRWSVTGIRPGPPIIAGGVVWTVDRGGALRGYSETDGSSRFANPVSVAGSFPSLSSFGGALFVQDGNRIMSFADA